MFERIFSSLLGLLTITVLIFSTGTDKAFAATRRIPKEQRSVTAYRREKETLTSINIVDRNGLSETICSKDKLKKYVSVDFLASQPYQKVLRIYKTSSGQTKSFLTAYHPNGQIKQYLEAINNRAYGDYREWFSNGQLKIKAFIIGGVADLNPAAETGWLFNGMTTAFNEDGNKIAEINYSKGSLEGLSLYYHDNGLIWKECPYRQNQLHGLQVVYLSNGEILRQTPFSNGKKSGLSVRFHSGNQTACEEEYKDDLLNKGIYYRKDGTVISQIVNGNGMKINFGKSDVVSTEEYKNGMQHGTVTVFDESSRCITRTYNIENGLKTGEEFFFYSGKDQPKMLITWDQGVMQGPVKTWYENGKLESCRQLSCNKKTGLLTAYYPSGQVMLVEEYENDLLIKGDYYKPGDKQPSSEVEKGNGTATLFTKNGSVYEKIIYQDGKPLLS